MKLVTLRDGGRIGVITGDDILDPVRAALDPAAAALPPAMAALLALGEAGLEPLRRSLAVLAGLSDVDRQALRNSGALSPLAAAALDAPVRPSLIWCMGRAYGAHRLEMMGAELAAEKGDPTGFQKSVHCLAAPGDAIRLPPQAPDMVDYEGEVAVVFGRRCHNVKREDAMAHVAGFTAVNDVSARNWIQFLPGGSSDVNRMGKQFPGFLPMGPCITTLDEYDDPLDVGLTTRLNGELVQETRTRELVWSIAEQIEYFSFWFTFEPGDILATGTPGGVGVTRKPPRFLTSGDVVSVTVEGVGTLENPVA